MEVILPGDNVGNGKEEEMFFQDAKHHHQQKPYICLENITYSVKQKKSLFQALSSSSSEPASPMLKILKNITCTIPRGSLTAIMGPSGAGKSTLMDILSAKSMEGVQSGNVLINGHPTSKKIRKRIGYCTQEDKLHQDLTVYETFRYVAMFMIREQSMDQIEGAVEEMIIKMGLLKARNTLISRVSGGERRRVSVGCSLMNNPAVMLGDEVTSGLDSFAVVNLMRVMKSLAIERNSTVVISIHQPSSAVFQMFDNVILLCDGHLMYSGPVSTTTRYFEGLGFNCPPGFAVGDFLLEVVCQSETPKGATDQGDEEQHLDDGLGYESIEEVWKPIFSGKEQTEEDEIGDSPRREQIEEPPRVWTPPELANNFASHHSEFSSYAAIHPENEEPSPSIDGAPAARKPEGEQAWLRQVHTLISRQFTRWSRDVLKFMQLFLTFCISSLVVGLLYSDVQINQTEQYTLGVAFSMYLIGIMTFNSIAPILVDRLLFTHECSAGYYSTSAYYFSHSLLTFLVSLPVTLASAALLYYLVDYPAEGTLNFLYFWFATFLNYQAFLSLTEWMGATFNDLDTALGVGSLFLTACMTLSGIMVSYDNIPSYLSFMYWGNHVTYVIGAQIDTVFDNDPNKDEIVQSLSIQVVHFRHNAEIILAFIVAYRVLTFLSLKFLHTR